MRPDAGGDGRRRHLRLPRGLGRRLCARARPFSRADMRFTSARSPKTTLTSNIVAVGNALFARDERHAPMRAVRPAGLKLTLRRTPAQRRDRRGCPARATQRKARSRRWRPPNTRRTNHLVVIMTPELEAQGECVALR